MSGNSNCTVYIGNVDERVSERVLYDILIQAGRVIDLHIPRDKETDKTKGFAFAVYETEEIADYAVKRFSGLISLYNRTLKFAISGQDKSSQSLSPEHSDSSHHYSEQRFSSQLISPLPLDYTQEQANKGTESDDVSSIEIKVLLFARARELTGVPDLTLRVPSGTTTLECMDKLVVKFPSLGEVRSCVVLALNEEYTTDSAVLEHRDELAIIPPISGG